MLLFENIHSQSSGYKRGKDAGMWILGLWVEESILTPETRTNFFDNIEIWTTGYLGGEDSGPSISGIWVAHEIVPWGMNGSTGGEPQIERILYNDTFFFGFQI